MTERIFIQDIPFDKITEQLITSIISENIKSNKEPLFIATPNPEMILESKKNPSFLEILQNTDINIPDGIGILWAANYLEKIKKFKSRTVKIFYGIFTLVTLPFNKKYRSILPEKITGTDLMETLCRDLPKTTRIFLLGAKPKVAEKTKKILEKKYNSKIVGISSESASKLKDRRLRITINNAKPDILFVAFGAPKQEKWIERNLPYLNSIKAVMGIGGAFDFISGEVNRAPLFMQKLGLEWLYRLFKQPSRIKRIINATVRFPLMIIKSSL